MSIVSSPGHFRGRGNRLHDQPGPEAREAMQDAALVSEQRHRNGNNSEDDGVHPDERIENEIRAQTAGPSVVPGNGCGRGLGRPARLASASSVGAVHLDRCFRGWHCLLDARAEQSHRLSYNVYRSGNNHHSIRPGRGSRQFRWRQPRPRLLQSGSKSATPLLESPRALAERGLSARVAITRSASGNRISAISPMALSRIAPKINVSGRSG